MKKNALFIALTLLTVLFAGYSVWGSKYSSKATDLTQGTGVSFELTPLASVKEHIREYRKSLRYPEHKDNLYAFYIPYSSFDKEFGPEGLFSAAINSLKPKGTNSAGVYYAKKGGESFNYLVFSDINRSRIEDATDHIYRIKGLNINVHRVLANHILTKKHADTDSSDIEILSSHRTCERNCPDWYPRD